MRVYIPASVSAGLPGLPLTHVPVAAAGSTVWGIEAAELAALRPDDAEELEFTAMQEAVLVTAERQVQANASNDHRVAIIAADIPDNASVPASAGDHARTLRAEEPIRIVSLHVSELNAQAILADEYAPDLLWFDPSELEEARAYAAGAEGEPGQVSAH